MYRIAILSGKGGTGKTLVSTNLAWCLHETGLRVHLLDADAEEPNDALFFPPWEYEEKLVQKRVPSVDLQKCSVCGECTRNCAFSAIHVSPGKALVLENLCHGCGLCTRVCPQNAIVEVPRTIGKVRFGVFPGGMHFSEGELHIAEPSAVPVIRELKKTLDPSAQVAIFDSPPGASCPVVEAVTGADFALLVSEPTPFGMHDLKAALATVSTLGVPSGVVLNRMDAASGDYIAQVEQMGGTLLGTLPFRREIAVAYAQGKLFAREFPEYVPFFEELAAAIWKEGKA
ncbi:MAG TPA: ATP-binding protein [Thermotogota bacterium]|nr:ATP-binding protein [Thermotogota bacterium]HRW91738.1 ATP-binding protein [Thermotogota bacterium]